MFLCSFAYHRVESHPNLRKSRQFETTMWCQQLRFKSFSSLRHALNPDIISWALTRGWIFTSRQTQIQRFKRFRCWDPACGSLRCHNCRSKHDHEHSFWSVPLVLATSKGFARSLIVPFSAWNLQRKLTAVVRSGKFIDRSSRMGDCLNSSKPWKRFFWLEIRIDPGWKIGMYGSFRVFRTTATALEPTWLSLYTIRCLRGRSKPSNSWMDVLTDPLHGLSRDFLLVTSALLAVTRSY